MIRVLVAEESLMTLQLLVEILESDPEIQVVGRVKNGLEAIEATRKLRPDIITMDIEMPVLNGVDATRRIMCATPTPIIVMSAASQRGAALAMEAFDCGALAVEGKPPGPGDPRFERVRDRLIRSVKTLSRVRVVERRSESIGPRHTESLHPSVRSEVTTPRVVAIGASTGGPSALNDILRALPGDFPVPIVVVQHISDGFIHGLANWLGQSSALRVEVARDGGQSAPGTVYLAPDATHLLVEASGRLTLSDAPRIRRFRPSATALFQSVASAYGPDALAVIMTGMGDDGLEGLRSVHASGGRIIAQDEATSVIFGMPRAAIDAGLADLVVPLEAIAPSLLRHTRQARGDATRYQPGIDQGVVNE